MRIQGVPVFPGRPCPHSTGSGCDDYAGRPEDPCIEFICGWRREGSPLPDWMKPDNAKVIVLLDQGVWRGLPLDVAVPVGRRIPPRALNYLKEFAETRRRVLLYSEQVVENDAYSNRQGVSAYGPPAFQEEMAERSSRGEKLIPDASDLSRSRSEPEPGGGRPIAPPAAP